MREILSTLKDIKELLKEGISQKNFRNDTKEHEDLNEESQFEYYDEPAEVEIAINEDADNSMECSNIDLGSIEYEETNDQEGNLKQFPLKTVADVVWLEKEIAKAHSPYRNKIVSFFYFIFFSSFLKKIWDQKGFEIYSINLWQHPSLN